MNEVVTKCLDYGLVVMVLLLSYNIVKDTIRVNDYDDYEEEEEEEEEEKKRGRNPSLRFSCFL